MVVRNVSSPPHLVSGKHMAYVVWKKMRGPHNNVVVYGARNVRTCVLLLANYAQLDGVLMVGAPHTSGRTPERLLLPGL